MKFTIPHLLLSFVTPHAAFDQSLRQTNLFTVCSQVRDARSLFTMKPTVLKILSHGIQTWLVNQSSDR